MGDPVINTSNVGLAYYIGINGLEQDKPYPAVRRQINIRSKYVDLDIVRVSLINSFFRYQSPS